MTKKHTDLMTCDPNDLVDLQDVRIDPALPLQERMAIYIKRIGNPYLFKVDGLIIKTVYPPDITRRLSDAVSAALSG